MAFEYAHPSVHATIALRPGQCRACLDEAPWRCAELALPGLSWCATHKEAYCRPPEPRKRTTPERRRWR